MDTPRAPSEELDLASEMRADLADIENVDDFAEEESIQSQNFSITSYGADYTVDLLVKRMRQQDFFVPPFQRQFVWSLKQSSKFIESLLLGLPVPGIFVYKEPQSNRHLIIDGQQRLKTLQYFYAGKFGKSEKSFRLEDVREPWLGKLFDELDEPSRRRLDDAVIHTTVFRQESPDNDASVYEVFERINSGGVKLSAQEIRVCVNFGIFTDMLRELNNNVHWRKIYGPVSNRLKDEELILRFFAFGEDQKSYNRPLRGFLNRYMHGKKSLVSDQQIRFRGKFEKMVEVCARAMGKKAFRPESALNAAVFDAVSVAISDRLERGPVSDIDILNAYESLLQNKLFAASYARATADEENVRTRFELARIAFNEI